jgi:hypothetical protein
MQVAVATQARMHVWLPTLLWLLIVFLSLATIWMIAVTIDRPTPQQWGFRGFEPALALSFGSVGALVATRRPENRFGWLLVGVSVVAALQGIVDQYPVLADAATPALPLAAESRWVAAWIWTIPSILFMTVVPLTFPDGRLISPRWRPAVLLAITALAVQIGLIVLSSEPFGPLPPVANPAPYFARFGPLWATGYALQLAAIVVAVSAGVQRYRAARGEVRQQIKWVAYAGVFLVLTAPAAFSGIVAGEILLIAAAFFASAAMAIAILRYRLYEIDIIINRTLVYGALSAILAGVYTASIGLSQRLFSAVTGDRSDAAIVLTTLIVVSLFTPIKTRLQTIVDKRLKTPSAPPAPGSPSLDALAQLDALRVRGIVTQAEFDAKKAELLARV